jgi:pimeloyl-ACP methyl ester carboxylesterase
MIGEHRANVGGVSTRVLSVQGSGIPVLFFHGYGDTADTWRGVLARLEEAGRAATAFDLPGFGQSGPRSPGPLLPQFDDFADAVLADFGPAVLVGNSLGAATAVRAASRRSESVKALVALDDPLYVRHLLARLIRRREVPERFWMAAARIPVPDLALRWVTAVGARTALYGPGAGASPEVIAQWRQSMATMADVATLGRYAVQYAYETRNGHEDVRVRCPTVIVHGERDRIIPVDASRILHQRIPGSSLVVLPRSGHCPQLDAPGDVVRLILGLLAKVEQAD